VRIINNTRFSVRPHPGPRGLILAAPAIFLLGCLLIAPVIIVLSMSLTDYNLGSINFTFIGLNNYKQLLDDPHATHALLNTFIYILIVVPAAFITGLFLAVRIQAVFHLRRFYEIIFFLPATSTFVSMALVWQYLLHGRIGPVNELIVQLGFQRIDFLTDPAYALPTLAVIGAWQLTGQTTVLFLAGLASLPDEIYQAASLDGVESGIDRFCKITFPMLGPTSLFVLVTTTVTAFQVFDSVAALTKGGPGGATETLLYRIYLEAYQFTNMGYACALSVVFLCLIAALSVLQIVTAEKKVHY